MERQAAGVFETRDKRATFERSMLPHMDAAYNLARWLTRNDFDAQDVVQEAYRAHIPHSPLAGHFLHAAIAE